MASVVHGNVEENDIYYNQCQAAYLQERGFTVDPKMIIHDDCDKEEDGRAVFVSLKFFGRRLFFNHIARRQ